MLGERTEFGAGEMMSQELSLRHSKLTLAQANCQAMRSVNFLGSGPSSSGTCSQRFLKKLKHPEGGDDGCLGDVLGGHRNLVVALLEIQPGKDS